MALSKSPNKNEAETALRLAQSMLEKYKLDSFSFLDEHQTSEKIEDLVGTQKSYLISNQTIWQSCLAETMAKHFSCGVFATTAMDKQENVLPVLCIIGAESDAASFKEVYSFLVFEMLRLRAEFALPESSEFVDSFYFGMIEAVGKLFTQANKNATKKHFDKHVKKGTELAVVAKTLSVIDQKRRLVDKLLKDITDGVDKSYSVFKNEGYSLGKEKGKFLDIEAKDRVGSSEVNLLK